jgi:hypothetical protein
LECLSDASFLGKLLVLPANVRLDWKVIARHKHSSLLGLVISNEGKKFYNIDTRTAVAGSGGGSHNNKNLEKSKSNTEIEQK